MSDSPTLLGSCAKAASAAEVRFRVDYPNSKARVSRIIALDEASAAIKDLFRLSPDFDERRVRAQFPFASRAFEDRIFDGLSKAGLPT